MKKRSAVTECLIDVIKKTPLRSVGLILAAAGAVGASLAPPQMLRVIADRFLIPGNYEGILWAAFGYFGLLALSNVFELLKRFLLIVIGQDLGVAIQSKMSEKLTRLKSAYYTSRDHGETASYFVNDVNTINYVFTNGVANMAVDMLKIIGILVSITLFSPVITLVVCGLAPVMIWGTGMIRKSMLAAQLESRFTTAKINNSISETFENVSMIKVLGKTEFMKRRWSSRLEDNYAAAERINFLDSITSPLTQVLRAAVIGAIIYLSAENYGITVGMLIASIDLINRMFEPLESVSTELQAIQAAYSGIKRVNEFCREEEEDRNEPAELTESFWEKPAEIEFSHVSFSYAAGQKTLCDISFKAAPKEKLAVVGRTGAGKTTLFSLITGLYLPEKGTVCINGIETYKIAPWDKRKLFAYVSQAFTPIAGTVFEQVSLKDERVGEEQVYDAMKTTGLHEVVLKLEHGYQSRYQEGMLSRGQEQLLSLARAIVLKPQILLLDEMSASLDSLSEERVTQVLEQTSGDMTRISISHRLSSILQSDRILYLKSGYLELVLEGTEEGSSSLCHPVWQLMLAVY